MPATCQRPIIETHIKTQPQVNAIRNCWPVHCNFHKYEKKKRIMVWHLMVVFFTLISLMSLGPVAIFIDGTTHKLFYRRAKYHRINANLIVPRQIKLFPSCVKMEF